MGNIFLMRKITTKLRAGSGKIKCEATEAMGFCAVGLPLFLFCRSESQNGFADFRNLSFSFSSNGQSERHGLRITSVRLKTYIALQK